MAQLVKTVQGLGIASVKTAQGLAIASAKTILGVDNTSSGGGTSPGTTGLLAWYDFANANDSSGNGYTLEEMNSPTFGTSSGTTYGATTDGTPGAYFQNVNLDADFGDIAGDWSFACRFQGKTGIANNDDIIFANGGRTRITWNTSTGLAGRLANINKATGVIPSVDTWYTVVVTWDQTSVRVYVDASAAQSASGAGGYNIGNVQIGGTSANSHPIWFDWLCFYGGVVLTADNATWLYNSGGTRTYAEL